MGDDSRPKRVRLAGRQAAHDAVEPERGQAPPWQARRPGRRGGRGLRTRGVPAKREKHGPEAEGHEQARHGDARRGKQQERHVKRDGEREAPCHLRDAHFQRLWGGEGVQCHEREQARHTHKRTGEEEHVRAHLGTHEVTDVQKGHGGEREGAHADLARTHAHEAC